MIRIWDKLKERFLEDDEWYEYTHGRTKYELMIHNEDGELKVCGIYPNPYDSYELNYHLNHLEVKYDNSKSN